MCSVSACRCSILQSVCTRCALLYFVVVRASDRPILFKACDCKWTPKKISPPRIIMWSTCIFGNNRSSYSEMARQCHNLFVPVATRQPPSKGIHIIQDGWRGNKAACPNDIHWWLQRTHWTLAFQCFTVRANTDHWYGSIASWISYQTVWSLDTYSVKVFPI